MYIGTVLRKEIRDPCFVGVFLFGARLKCTYCLTFAYPSVLQHVRHCVDNLCDFLLCHYLIRNVNLTPSFGNCEHPSCCDCDSAYCDSAYCELHRN